MSSDYHTEPAAVAIAYAEGLRDGKVSELENRVDSHHIRLNSHSTRLQWLERISWIVIGGISLMQFGPLLVVFLKRMAE